MPSERKDPVVWAEIPVTDMARAKTFYESLLGAPLIDEMTPPNPIAMLPGAGDDLVAGHIYPGKPAPKGTGPTVHLRVAGTLEDAMARVRAGGGEVVSEIITIPAGSFAYALDPDGNSIGLFKV